MGIRWFETFLKEYPAPLLTSCNIHNQYVVIDGSEIKYQLYSNVRKYGRSNYVEYRENIKKFFSTLEECGIKPILVFDGFKFENNISYYISKRNKKIARMASEVKTIQRGFTKPLQCETVFWQTIKELNIPCVNALQDTNEDLAALAKIINAPVLATDTEFCAYSLQDGFIPLSTFHWKNPRTNGSQRSISAKIFRIDDFIEILRINQEAVRFLAIIFQNQHFETYKKFRERELKSVHFPSHFRFSSRERFKRPNCIENCLIWFYNNGYESTENVIETILSTLPHHMDAEEAREKINADLHKYLNPQIRVKILREVQEQISDSNCRVQLEMGIERFWGDEKQEDKNHGHMDDEEQDDENHDHILNYLQQRLSGACMDIILAQEQGKPCIVYLTLIPTDATVYESPQKVAVSIRKAMYSLLVRSPRDSIGVKEFDRVGLKYEEIEDITVVRCPDDFDIFRIHESEDGGIYEKRRSFLLSVLIESQEHRNRFENEVMNLSDDMKLTLASTIYWINQTKPDHKLIKSFVFLFTILQLKQTEKEVQVKSLLEDMTKRAGGSYFNVEILQFCGQWEACLKASIQLNETLSYPFPTPTMGKIFSGCLLEQIYNIMEKNEKDLQESLRRLTGANELEKRIHDILSE